MYDTWRLSRPKSDGTVRVINIDLGTSNPLWWASNPPYTAFNGEREIGGTITLKVPGSSQWASRGLMKYLGTYFKVLRILNIDPEGNLVCEPLIDFPLRQGHTT